MYGMVSGDTVASAVELACYVVTAMTAVVTFLMTGRL